MYDLFAEIKLVIFFLWSDYLVSMGAMDCHRSERGLYTWVEGGGSRGGGEGRRSSRPVEGEEKGKREQEVEGARKEKEKEIEGKGAGRMKEKERVTSHSE